MAPSVTQFPLTEPPQDSIPFRLASALFSSLAISSPSPQARASLIGVGIATAGNVLISIALNVQKLSHMRLADQKSSTGPDSEGRNGDRDERQGSTGNDDQVGYYSRRNGSEGEEEISDETAPLTPSPSNRTYGGLNSSDHKKSPSKGKPSSSLKKDGGHEYCSNPVGSSSNGDDAEGSDRNGSRLKQRERSNGDENFNHSDGPGSEFLHSKLWWLGISLMALGEAGNFLSYGFAPASLVAPLGAVALLSNVLISPLLLGPQEKFSRSDFGGMLLATIGAVTVVFSSKESDTRLGPDELWAAVKRLEFFIYAGVSALFASTLMLLSRTRLAERFVLIDVGVCALFGGFTVLSTKGLSSLLAARNPLDVIKYPITYVLVVILASTAVAQITYLNRALYRFDSREVIPTQFVFFTISAIVGSAILYRDFENVEPHRFINFIFGCLTTFAGVFILTRSRGSGSEAIEEREGEDSTTTSPISTPRRGRRRMTKASSSSSGFLEVPQEFHSPQAVKVDILTPLTPTSEAERGDSLTPLKPPTQERPGLTTSMTTGSVPLTTSRIPKPRKQGSGDLSGSLPNSSTPSALNERAFSRNQRLGFPSPRSSPRTTPGLGFSAGHYLLLATPSGSSAQGLLVPVESSNRANSGKSSSNRHVRTRSQSTPGRRRNSGNESNQRRNRGESSEGDLPDRNPGTSQVDRSAQTEIGDLEMEFEEEP